MADNVKNVFIVGSKGIPGGYGGYETFVDKLTEYHQTRSDIRYHVACKAKENSQFEYNNARCFKVKVPNIGPAQAIYYDVKAINECLKYIKQNNIDDFVIYVLACRIGPWTKGFAKKVHRLGGKLYVNPDGHEWKRSKWSAPVRAYWKFSEKLMVKNCDLLVCDSKNIEKYIHEEYKNAAADTTFIAYGAEVVEDDAKTNETKAKYIKWCQEKGLKEKDYYLVVGRFVPENNYETMIREFMASKTNRKLVIITTDNDKFMKELDDKLKFKKDERIVFPGSVYDQELLSAIRSNAYAYLHGHEVGGTNPSLLEALGSTNINLLVDVGFNKEVAEDAAKYWNKDNNNLATLIDEVDGLKESDILELGKKAKLRISKEYTWDIISQRYMDLWENSFR